MSTRSTSLTARSRLLSRSLASTVSVRGEPLLMRTFGSECLPRSKITSAPMASAISSPREPLWKMASTRPSSSAATSGDWRGSRSPAAPAASAGLRRFGLRQIDELDVALVEPHELERGRVSAKGGGAPEVDRGVRRGADTEALVAEIEDGADAVSRQREDDLRLVRPGEPDHAGVAAGGARPDRGDVATLAERVVELVVEVRLANGRVDLVLQGADGDAVLLELLFDPAALSGDTEGRRNGAARVPEVSIRVISEPFDRCCR